LTYHVGLATHKILILTPLAYNLSPTSAPVFTLPDHALITLEGPDAVAFAHAQFANDVAGLAPGHWQWNAWLTPKGRVIAVFALARLSGDRLWLVLPDHPADVFADALRRFVFRRKLKIEVPADTGIAGTFATPASAQGAAVGEQQDVLELDFSGDGGARTLYAGRLVTSDDPALPAAWRVADLCHGLPCLPESQREQWTPQQLALDRLSAYSVKKGCYPGQEIVARTHFLGKAKRALRCFRTDGPVIAGMPVRESDRDIGEVVCTAQDGERTILLAVLPLEHAGGGLAAGDGVLEPCPLLDGLRR
jgi:folate-binding protein YgfZ